MHALVLLSAAAIDTAAVVKGIHDFFGSVLPGLPDGLVAWLTTLILGVPVMAAVFSTEWVGALLLSAAPPLALVLAPFWTRWKGIILPILAALFAGGFFHNPTVGLGAGVVWGMLNSILKGWGAKSTPAGILKAKSAAVAILALALLAVPSASRAAEKEHYSLLSLERVSLSPGAGYRWDKGLENARAVPYVDLQVGYAATDHVKATVRYGQSLGPLNGGKAFGEARVGLVF